MDKKVKKKYFEIQKSNIFEKSEMKKKENQKFDRQVKFSK